MSWGTIRRAALTSLAVQWLRVRASTAGGTGSIPGWESSTGCTGWPKRKKKKRRRREHQWEMLLQESTGGSRQNPGTNLRAVSETSAPEVSEKRIQLYSSWQGMDSRTCLVIKLQSGHSLPYSRMSKENKTQQPRENLLQNRRKEATSRSLLRRACSRNWSTVDYWKLQGTDSLSRSQMDFLKGKGYESLKKGNSIRTH